LDNPDFTLQPASRTFHGRDIFAPMAAHLAAGASFEDLGSGIDELEVLSIPLLELKEGPEINGEVMHSDRFGNLITSIGSLRSENKDLLLEPWLLQCPPARLPEGGLRVHLPNGAHLSMKSTFSDVEPGAAVAYVGSSGLLEIGINCGSALESLPIEFGQQITLSYRG
jgi:S-adenosylmethionine hydrolase